MEKYVINHLKNCYLFQGIDEKNLEELAKYFRTVRFPQDAVICKEGDLGNTVYVITEGEVVVQKELGLLQRELSRLQPGEAFGEMALISEGRRSATLKTVNEVECLEMGGEDFSRLLDENTLFARHILSVLTERLRMSDESATQDILGAYRALVFSLAKLAESRDPETGAHLNRVRDYSVLLAELLLKHPRYREQISSSFIESIFFVSPLHDIGKVAIPDGILLKQGKLTDREYGVMKTHTTAGAETIRTVTDACSLIAFRMAYNIVLHHHERYDGTGYPEGLQGDDIPLEARIMALADVYDALLSRRPYKKALSYGETADIIRESTGTHFDPDMTGVMLENIEAFEGIHGRYLEG